MLLGSTAFAAGCKKDQPTCNPDEHDMSKVQVVIQPAEQLNPDEEGNPLSVVMRLYQLKGDQNLELVDFDTVWQQGGEAAFGEEFLAEQEVVVYPAKSEILEVKPDPEMTHLVAVAIFREPVGRDWMRVWERPKYHGHSFCNAQKQKKPWPEPCFYVVLDRYLIDGGHSAPAGFDAQAVTVQCPGPPMKTPPPLDTGDKKKKKKRRKLKDAKAPEVPETPQTPETPQAPQAPSAPEAPSAPQAPSKPEAPGG